MFRFLISLAFLLPFASSIHAQKATGHEYVDLGLPGGTKWATCNVGASAPEESGDFFQWGELNPFRGADTAYQMCRLNNQQAKDISGDSSFDVAASKWGGTWRIPTKNDFDELLDYCEWTFIAEDGIHGYEITGPNGKSIFLPCGGIVYEMGLESEGTSGSYWTSTPYGKDNHLAFAVGFADPWDPDAGQESDEDTRNVAGSERHFGMSIRPVMN